jgi:hypothetical protein
VDNIVSILTMCSPVQALEELAREQLAKTGFETTSLAESTMPISVMKFLLLLTIYPAVILGALWACCAFFPMWFPGWRPVQVSSQPGTVALKTTLLLLTISKMNRNHCITMVLFPGAL